MDQDGNASYRDLHLAWAGGGWLADRETEVLAAGRVHADLWAATWLDAGAAASSVRRPLSAKTKK